MIHIRVPATSANLGAGFDTLGLAVRLYNEIDIQLSDKLIIRTDRGIPTDARNLVIQSMKRTCERMGKTFRPVQMKQTNGIPTTSGLGSSAACHVLAVAAANELFAGGLSRSDMLDIATELDGHPDNVAPAIYGGVTVSVVNDGHVTTLTAPKHSGIAIALATPKFTLSTKQSRSVLPDVYPRADLVYSASRAAATFAVFATGEYDKLSAVVGDRIHEPYRMPLIKDGNAVRRALKDGGAYATYLSGAGPTIAAFVKPNFAATVPHGWTLRVLALDDEGVVVTRS